MALRRHWFFGFRAARVALGVIALSGSAFAQAPAQAAPPATPAAPVPAPARAPAPAVAPAVPTPAAPAPVAPTTVAPVVPEEPLPPAGSLPELPPPSAADAAASSDVAPAADEDWYDSFDVHLFADAYFNWNYNSPKPQSVTNDVTRAFDSGNGFSLAWAGIDVSHAADPIGGALSLRFGPAARRYNSSCPAGAAKCDAAYGLENVKQAFASWRPGGEGSKVTLDFGKFDTIYGAEVAESQDNINYTRGVLYWLGQPAFHTGFRLNAELSSNFIVRALVVNGWNNTIDNNTGKTFGLQATAHTARSDSHDWFAASLGYLGGPEQDDTTKVVCPAGSAFDVSSPSGCTAGAVGSSSGTVDRPTNDTKGWRHFVDFVVTSDPTDALHLVLNADLGVENRRDPIVTTHFAPHSWLGGMIGARYLIVPSFAVAARGELYQDKDGVTTGSEADGTPITGATITTGTLTLDYLPGKNLMLRLENRVDHSTKEMFPKGVRDLVGNLFTTTLGVVVSTN